MKVTASKVGLLPYCQWWARDDAPWPPQTSGPLAERGTRFHQAIARYTLTRQREEVAEDIAAEYEHACAWVDEHTPRGLVEVLVEVAFAWDPSTDDAEVLVSVGDRDYSRGAGRLCGTADLVLLWRKPTAAAYVYDWKTGDGSGAGPQLGALAVMVSRAFGIDTVSVSALEVSKHGVEEVAVESFDAFALAGLAGELAELVAKIPDAEPQPGSHCGELYCPARLTCPAGQGALAEVVDVIPAEALVRRPEWRITDPVTTPEHAMWTLDVLRLMGTWVEAKKDEIKAKVPADGWRAEDGRVLRETTATIEAFDKKAAVALCKELGATDEQIGRLYYTFQKSNGLRVGGGDAPKKRARKPRAA